MIKEIKNIIKQTKKFYLLGVTIRNEKENFYLLEILFKDEELFVLSRFNFLELNETTIKKISKDYPIILHLEGDSVISKETINTVGYRNNLIFKSDPNQFYFYEYLQDHQIFVSLTRKDTLNVLLKRLNEFDKYVVHVSFGPFVLVNLLSVLKNEDTLVSNSYEVKIQDQKIDTYQKKYSINYSYKIGNEDINEQETVLLASLIEYLYPNPNVRVDLEYLSNNKEQFKFKKLFKFYGAAVLVTILIALFASHFMLQKSTQDLAEKESLASISNQTLIHLNDLKDERILKEKVLVSSGVIDKNYITKYLSDIGHTVPRAISLDFINVKRPIKKIKPNEKVAFDLQAIEIGGYTNNDNAFNNWIKSLKTINWIEKIEIIEYQEDSKSKNSFLISVDL